LQKIEEFRLLSLNPHTVETEMQGCLTMSLSNYNMNRAPDYEALSYAWGDRKDTVKVECNGQSLQITRNLHAALARLQPSEEEGPRTLWVDAICINQEDSAEKSKQILLISRIFTNAQEVLIWLGEDDENSGIAFEAMKEIADLAADLRKIAEEEVVEAMRPRELEHVEKKLLAMRRLFQRLYFSRLWVVQKVSVSRKATWLCGHRSSMAMAIFVDAHLFLIYHRYDIRSVDTMRARRFASYVTEEMSQEHKGLTRLLEGSRDLNTSDPRDKVFAVLGMCTERDEEGFGADYAKTTEEVYAWFVRKLIEKDQSLRILGCVSSQNETGSRLRWPSWVPRLDQNKISFWLAGSDIVCDPAFSAARGTKPIVMEGLDQRTLCLRGFRLDRIRQCLFIGDCIVQKSLDHPTLLKILEQWDPAPDFSAATESRYQALYRTLTADIGFKSARLKDTFKVVRFSKARQWFREHDVNEDVDPIAALEIVHHIQTQLIGRDVFVTQRGNLVLGPRDAQYGDMVCVLFGGDVPFVLGPESEKFRLLGECDVHGIMDGEAMDMVGKEAYEDLILL
jgi:hypothetical protein